MIAIIRIAVGILLAGIVFWVINGILIWIRGAFHGVKVARNQPEMSEDEILANRVATKHKIKKYYYILFNFMRHTFSSNYHRGYIFLIIMCIT